MSKQYLRTTFVETSSTNGKMGPRNILIVIASLLILGQSSPPNIGRGTYTYDPNSIIQNERILRLFLRLASHTANHLIYLKKEARNHEESKFGANANNLPEVRIGLKQKIPEEEISNSRHNDRSGSLGPYNGWDPRTTTYEEPLRNRYDFANKYTERVNGADIPTREDRLFNEYAHGEYKNSHIFLSTKNDQARHHTSEETKSDIENRLFNDKKNDYVTRNPENKSLSTKMNNITSPNQAEMIPRVQPVISNSSKESSGFDENSRKATNNHASTAAIKQLPIKASTLPILLESGDQNGNSDPAVVQEIVSIESGLRSNMKGTSATLGEDSTGSQNSNLVIEPEAMTAGSNFQSASIETQSPIAGASTHQAVTAAPNFQFGSTELSNSVQDVESNRQNREASETLAAPSDSQISTQTQNSIGRNMLAQKTMAAELNLQSGLIGSSNPVQRLTPMGRIAGNGITLSSLWTAPKQVQKPLAALTAHETLSTDSNLQPGSRIAKSPIGPSGGDEVAQVGTSLIGRIPPFGSFPKIKEQSLNLGMSKTDTREGLQDVPNRESKNSQFRDSTIEDEGGVSEWELRQYANRFANALRPFWPTS